MYRAKVYVTLKPAVNDPQGSAVRGGLHSLGFAAVQEVRVGKYLEIQIDAAEMEQAREQVAQMCQQLLANPVIEAYRLRWSRIRGLAHIEPSFPRKRESRTA